MSGLPAKAMKMLKILLETHSKPINVSFSVDLPWWKMRFILRQKSWKWQLDNRFFRLKTFSYSYNSNYYTKSHYKVFYMYIISLHVCFCAKNETNRVRILKIVVHIYTIIQRKKTCILNGSILYCLDHRPPP